jgi:hypothetical protein
MHLGMGPYPFLTSTIFRALVDSGAEVSLIHSRVFVNLKDKPKVFKKKAHLQSVNGQALNIEGCANITIKIGKTEVTQLFYIFKDMNRNDIECYLQSSMEIVFCY